MRKSRIMIVDDEESICTFMGMALRSEGVEVTIAGGSREAESFLENDFFDVVIADIRLGREPGREGMELLSHIREVSPGTRVMVMTAFGSQEIEKEAYDRGASFYFEKPIDIRVIGRRLREMGISAGFTAESRVKTETLLMTGE